MGRVTSLAAAALASVIVVGSPAAVAVSPAALDRPAVAVQQAGRGQRINPIAFPMNPSPRCDVLDNFGDPRGDGRTHQGVDILATLGQEVYATVVGTLTAQSIDGASGTSLSGNTWTLTAASDGSGYAYMHLSAFAADLRVGSEVRAGQLIGYVGDTGNAGPGNYHLHFEYHPLGGAAVDPMPILRPAMPAGCTVY